jgi:hypothetical protein
VTNLDDMNLNEMNGLPTIEQIVLWQEMNDHSNAWLARKLGIDVEDIRLCLELGLHDEDLRTIAELMTHPRENPGW